MLWRNRLEPGALVDQFAAHLPEGFAPLAGVPAPGFEAPFDLLTTADDALKARLRSLPGFSWWSRLLRLKTGFVGTTVTEYVPVPAEVPAATLAQDVRRGPGARYKLSIIKDIPQDSPLLSAADNAFAQKLADTCAAQGFVLVEGQALAYVQIDFDSIDAYLQRLSASRRQNLRRKLRSRTDVQVRTIPTGTAFMNDDVTNAYYALYEEVYAQSEVHFERLTRAFVTAVLRDDASEGVVFEYRHATTDKLLAWNLCYAHDGRLVDKYIGMTYPDARDHNLYFVSWMQNLEYALERKLTHYVAGWTDPQVKRSLGAKFTFTRHAVYVRNPLLRALARRFAGRFESDAQWRDQAGKPS